MEKPRKKLALAILAAAKPDKFKADEEEPAEEEMGEEEAAGAGAEEACRDFFAMGKAGDHAGAVDALKDLLEIVK